VSPISNLGLAVVMITIFAFAIAWMNEPTVLNRYTSTVIAGKIGQSPIPISQVLLLRSPMMDTVLSIPVEKDQFHTQVTKDLTPGIYFLKAGSQVSRVFMGNKDSTFLNISFKDQKPIVKISGTRVAENDYLSNGKNTDLEILEYYANRSTPEHFADNMLEYYADGVRALQTFRTSDRIKPADDFIQIRKKLFAAQMLRLADAVYPKAFAAYYPNKELQYPQGVKDMRGNIRVNEPALISFPEYRKYVTDLLRAKAGPGDSTFYKLLRDSLHDAYTRDVMLYEVASGSISRMKDSIRRNKLVADLATNMQTSFVKTKLLETNDRANNGKPAYPFTAESWKGKEIRSADLSGRYMIIEFRSANCTTCKNETPFFESLADRYTNPEVAFISLALDNDKKTWLKEEKTKKETKAIQLLLKDDIAKITAAYGLNGSPKFVLIDREGKIMYAQMPMPSDPAFETILQKELSTDKRY
jgi:peroxiredoxin